MPASLALKMRFFCLLRSSSHLQRALRSGSGIWGRSGERFQPSGIKIGGGRGYMGIKNFVFLGFFGFLLIHYTYDEICKDHFSYRF